MRHSQPRRGTQAPWLPLSSYLDDRDMLKSREIEADGVLEFLAAPGAPVVTLLRNARIENVGKCQSCMVSKLRMI